MEGRDEILDALKTYVREHPDYQIEVTGHSLGGGVANICAYDIGREFPDRKIVLTMYGCPRVGNVAFAQHLTANTNLVMYRFVHYNDIVPHTPPRDLRFVHAGREYWSPGVKNREIIKCKMGKDFHSDPACSKSMLDKLSAKAHSFAIGVDRF